MHGTTLDSIYDIYGTIESAGRQLLLDFDPQETKRVAALANPIFDQIYDYAIPVDVKGNKVIDIRPQANRQKEDYFYQTYGRAFDYTKNITITPQFSVQFNSGVKTIRISDPLLNTGIKINDANIIQDSGLWAVSGNASDLAEDNINYVYRGSSLRFNLAAAAGTGSIANSTFTSVDLSTHLNQGTIFTYVDLPTGGDFTSVALQWGSDTSNYWSKSVTINYQGNAFNTGWNLLGFDWATATKVGNPDETAIDYLDIIFTYDGTLQTAVRVNSIISRLGMIWEMVYYSKYLYRNASTGAFQEEILDDSDLINLDTDSYNLLLEKTCEELAQQQQGYSALQFDAKYFKDKYDANLKTYKGKYKSEISLPQSTYYQKPNSGYSRFAGFRTSR
jgi:hypothetical protein